MRAIRILLLSVGAALVVSATPAAEPPSYMNYQGVLRDSADNPLDGDHEMTFRYLGPSGLEIMIEDHLASHTGAVQVHGGLFNVVLGSGRKFDGASPGFYQNLRDVFRDHPDDQRTRTRNRRQRCSDSRGHCRYGRHVEMASGICKVL